MRATNEDGKVKWAIDSSRSNSCNNSNNANAFYESLAIWIFVVCALFVVLNKYCALQNTIATLFLVKLLPLLSLLPVLLLVVMVTRVDCIRWWMKSNKMAIRAFVPFGWKKNKQQKWAWTVKDGVLYRSVVVFHFRTAHKQNGFLTFSIDSPQQLQSNEWNHSTE